MMKKNFSLAQEQLQRRIGAAQGRIESDLTLKNVNFLDVFSCQWKKGDVTWVDDVIVGIEPGLPSKRVVDAKGKWLVPGFIDAPRSLCDAQFLRSCHGL